MATFTIYVPMCLMGEPYTISEFIRKRIGQYIIAKGQGTKLADYQDPMGGDFDVTLIAVEGKNKVQNPLEDLARAVVTSDCRQERLLLFVVSRQLMGWQPPADDPDFPNMKQPLQSALLEFIVTEEVNFRT